MNILIAGGTGLLGSKAAEIMINHHHEVTSLAMPFEKGSLDLPSQMKTISCDFNLLTDQELDTYMEGMDAFVFAAGVDERLEFARPVMKAYEKYNIVPMKRMLASAKRMHVKKAIVLGSYFSYFAKSWPHLELDKKHPYIASRLYQEEVAFSFVDTHFSVNVLELPYIFGPQRGRKPVWSIFIERFAKPKIIFFPKGGTSVMTTSQVGYAIYHAILYGKHQMAYPLGYLNMTWRKLISVVLSAMNQKKPIVTIPNFMTQLAFKQMKKGYEKKGIEPGLNPLYFAKLMTSKTMIDPMLYQDLRIPDDDVYKAINQSISYAYEIYINRLKVTEMKAL